MGPVCKYSLTVVSRFAAYWNKPVITTGGEQEGFRNKDGDYRLLTTISNIYTTELTELVVKFLEEKTDWYVFLVRIGNCKHILNIIPIHICRKVLRFLFHNYPADEKPQKYSKCQQTLQTMFLTLGGGTQKGVMNHNLTFESFDQDNLNKSNIESLLKRVEEKARGKRHFIHIVEKMLKGTLDLIPSPSPSVKIQIMGGKVCLWCKGKTLLGVVNNLFVFKRLLTMPSNVLPLHLNKLSRQ